MRSNARIRRVADFLSASLGDLLRGTMPDDERHDDGSRLDHFLAELDVGLLLTFDALLKDKNVNTTERDAGQTIISVRP